ncbi:MAG: ester cyclase [Actinomycetota bacterium]
MTSCIPPTGKHATWSETHICRMANGKVAEHWQDTDELGMLRQLGVVPAE